MDEYENKNGANTNTDETCENNGFSVEDTIKKKKLYRCNEGKKIFGVCKGLAEYLDVDVTIIRVIYALLVCVFGIGLLPYIIMALILPEKEKALYGD